MVIGIVQAAANLGSAVALGAVIGFERQWRQRLAGLRTMESSVTAARWRIEQSTE